MRVEGGPSPAQPGCWEPLPWQPVVLWAWQHCWNALGGAALQPCGIPFLHPGCVGSRPGHRAGHGALSRAWAGAAAALQEWCPQVSGLSSVFNPVVGLELWMWIPSRFWDSCDVVLTSYAQKCYFWNTHDCVCYVVGVWASDWRLLVWTTLWWRLFQGRRYDSLEIL